MAWTSLWYLCVKAETTTPPTITPIKPTHFLRFMDGDIKTGKTILWNDPIQNVRRKSMNAVQTTESSEGEYNMDLDPVDCPYFIRCCLGSMSSADISSATDASVFRHTMTVAKTLPSLTIEQCKWDPADTTNDQQNYAVLRAYGAIVDSLTFSAKDGKVNMNAKIKAHGVFEVAKLMANAAAWSSVALSLDTVTGLTTSDTVNIYDATPQSETDAIASISTTNVTITIATLGNSYTTANYGKVELKAQTPSYSNPARVLVFKDANFQFWVDLTAAASASETNIEDWTLTYENNCDVRYGSMRGWPSVIAPRRPMAKLTYTKYFQTVVDRDTYLRVLPKAIILTLTYNEVVSATDTGLYKYSVKFKMNKVHITTHDMPTASDDVYATKIEAEVFYNETDGAAFSCEVINWSASTVYTA